MRLADNPGFLHLEDNTQATNFDYGKAFNAQVSLMLPNADKSIYDYHPAKRNIAKPSRVEFNTDARHSCGQWFPVQRIRHATN